MPKLRASILAALWVAFLLPANAWGADVRVTLDLPGGTGDLVGFPLQLGAGNPSFDVGVFLFTDRDPADVTGFVIELASTDLPMLSYTWDPGIPNINMGQGVTPTSTSINANDFPNPIFSVMASPMLLGILTVDLSTLGGAITLGGAWTDDSHPFGTSVPFDNDGDALVTVPEPQQWTMLATGVSLLGFLSRSKRRVS
jgi:hypothetical protein